MKTKSIKCQFKNSRGFSLDARLDIPDKYDINSNIPFIVFSHCFTCSKETITTFRLSRLLAGHNCAVLRFDFTGLGGSKGMFSATDFSTTQDDLRSAIHYLQQHYYSPAFLMGHSLGGTTSLSIAQEIDSVTGVVCIASPSSPDHVLHHFGHSLTLLEQNIPASFEVAGQYFDIEPGFVDNVRHFDMPACLAGLDKPVLVFNVENDALVDENNAREIQQWVKGRTDIVNLTNTDHLLSDRQSSEAVARQIVAWMKTLF